MKEEWVEKTLKDIGTSQTERTSEPWGKCLKVHLFILRNSENLIKKISTCQDLSEA